ncbi:MAG: PAS domain S-box protein [Ignavibacteriales bacterium]|nr:PAS domain S-box protein [Ignavibacteriales bacterium]
MKNRGWIASIILMFALCAYLFIYFYETERERKINEIINHQKIHAKQAARSFNELIDKWNSVLLYLSKDRSVTEMNDDGRNELERLFRVLKDEIAGITRTDANGRIIYTVPYYAKSIGVDISKQKHMVKILSEHQPVVSDVFMAVQGFQAIVIHYPIFKNGKYEGSIAFLLNFERITKEILDEIKIGSSVRAWLLSADGIELYCENRNHIGKSAFETTESSVDVKRLAQIMMSGKEGTSTYVFTDKKEGNVNAVVYFLPVKVMNTFWSLAIASSEAELGAPLFYFSIKLLLIFAVLFIGGIFLAGYVFKARAIFKESEARKKAEEELKHSEERHRLISEVASDYIFTTSLDKNGIQNHDWISGAFSSMTEYSFEEYRAIGGWKSLVHPEDREKDARAFELLQKNQPAISEVRTVTKSGKILWVRVFARPIWDDQKNKLAGIYGAVQNITESKSAENALRQSEERFRTIYNSVNDAMFIHDLNTGAILDVNETMEKMFGVTREEAIQADMNFLSEGNYPYSNKEALQWIFKARDEGPQRFEWLAKKKSGELFWVEISMSPVVIAGEKRLLVSARDISKRKNIEDQLNTLRLAVEQSPVSVVITDVNGMIEYVNAGFCEISGYDKDEIIKKSLRILNQQKQSEINSEEIWKNLREGKEWRGDYLNKKKDGSAYWETTLISPVKDNEGKTLHLLAVQEDITERKKFEIQLLLAKEKAEEMYRLKSNFLSNMSHELRTPLVGMLGLTELLYNELEGDNQEFVALINKSSNRLLNTLNTLLNYSKIDAEKVVVNLSRSSILEIIREEVKLFEALANRNGLYIREDFKCRDFSTITDVTMVKEILDNLLNNAIRFTFKGGIVVTADRTDKEIIISIKDTGIGIPEDKIKIIFEEFRQVSEGRGRNFEGTGLGLTIVKKYVSALKGDIKVESKLEVGSNFIVTIPVNQVLESELPIDGAMRITSESKLPEPEIEKVKILLVEDDEINSFAISQMLKRIGDITEVNNAEDAIRLTNTGHYDIILMDINLRRGKSGVEAANAIRENNIYANTPIVAITAYAMSDDRTEFLSLGFTHYLSKPFSQDQIQKLILEIINELPNKS